MAALARSEHERAARSLPAAALPQRAFSENTTKRDIPTFVRARIREFEAVLPRPFYLWSVRRASRWRHRLASTASRRCSRVDGVRGRSPRSFAGGARVRRNSGSRKVVAHDARRERGLGLGHPLLLPAARPGGTSGGVSFHWDRGDGVRVGQRYARRRRARRRANNNTGAGGLVRGGRKAQLREAGVRPAAQGRARGRARRRARVPRRAPRGAAGREGRPDDAGNLAVAPRVRHC